VEKIFRNSKVGIEPVYIRNVAWFDKKTLNLQAFETTGRGPHVNMHSRDIVTYHLSPRPLPTDTFKIPAK
jgi:hypothetical protein